MLYMIFLLMGITIGSLITYLLVWNKSKKVGEREKAVSLREINAKKLGKELLVKEASLTQREKVVVSYEELQSENKILKTDLQNIDVVCRKLQLDRNIQENKQEELDKRGNDLAKRYLDENVKLIGKKLSPSNYSTSKERLKKVIERCRGIGFEISSERESELLEQLKTDYEMVVRLDLEKQEQARIKAQIREEEKIRRESERIRQQAEREKAAIEAALEKALQEAADEHSEEIENLRAKLKEAEEKNQRAISMAQQTRAGHVYVISNIGSFGEDIFKIGMTRRLEPHDRVRELSCASVPFPFDVHMMISSDDAPKLENTLHKELHTKRINKVNFRKEFFRTSFDDIRLIVEKNHGEVTYIADAEALEYRDTMNMSDEDFDFVEKTYERLEEDDEVPVEDDV